VDALRCRPHLAVGLHLNFFEGTPLSPPGELDLLVDSHLLEEARRHKYRFHDLIRIFAAECAEREPLPLREAALTRLLQAEQPVPERRVAQAADRDEAWAGALPL